MDRKAWHVVVHGVAKSQTPLSHWTNWTNGQPCLPDFRENAFSFLPLRIMFAVGLSYMAFIMLCYLYAYFLESFYHKWVLNFVKSFLCIYWEYHIIFILKFVNIMYHIDWFTYTEESLHIPVINITWSWCMILLICCWILFANILLRIFVSMFIGDISL